MSGGLGELFFDVRLPALLFIESDEDANQPRVESCIQLV